MSYYLHINSDDAISIIDTSTWVSSCDGFIDRIASLDPSVRPNRFRVHTFSMRGKIYNINKYNSRLTIRTVVTRPLIGPEDDVYDINIPHGNYNFNTICQTLQDLLNDVTNDTKWFVTPNKISGKVLIGYDWTASAPSITNFSFSVLGTNTYVSLNPDLLINPNLGFNVGEDISSSNVGTIATIISPNIVDLTPLSEIYIRSQGIGGVYTTKEDGQSNIVAIVPVNSNIFENIQVSFLRPIECSYNYVSSLTLSLRDRNDRPIDISNNNVTMLVEFYRV